MMEDLYSFHFTCWKKIIINRALLAFGVGVKQMCRLHVKCFISEKDTRFGVSRCDERSLVNSE